MIDLTRRKLFTGAAVVPAATIEAIEVLGEPLGRAGSIHFEHCVLHDIDLSNVDVPVTFSSCMIKGRVAK